MSQSVYHSSNCRLHWGQEQSKGSDPSQMVTLDKSHTLPDSVAPCEIGYHDLKKSTRIPTNEHCSEPCPWHSLLTGLMLWS